MSQPRLDRLVRFDERSRSYPIRAVLPERAPRSFTWRCTEWYDQGEEGQCVAYSWAAEASARPAETGRIDTDRIRSWYWAAQQRDQWPGGAYPGADPFYEGTSVLAGAQVMQDAGYITHYRWAFSLKDLVQALGYVGPAVLGVNWREGMVEPDAHGLVRATGDVVGGHAILARGVSLKRREVLLRNSWGRDWGWRGDCRVSFADLEALLADQGEACIPVGRRRAPTTAG